MKTDQQKGLTTMAIKARVANQIRTELYKKQPKEITDKEKLAFFDKVFDLNTEMHWELNFLKDKRKKQAKIHAIRLQNGYYAKRKIKAEAHKQHTEWQKSLLREDSSTGVEGTFI